MSKLAKKFRNGGKADLLMPILVFLAVQVVCLGMGMYKLNIMGSFNFHFVFHFDHFKQIGLLPTTSADWLSYLPERVFDENSAVVEADVS